MNIPLTPLRFLHYAERQYPNRTAVVCQGKRFSYEQMGKRVGQLAAALKAAGVQPGDRVAFLGVNTHRLLEAYYGVLEAKAVLLPLNIRLSATELCYIINDAGASFLFIEENFIPLVDSFRNGLKTVKRFCQLGGEPRADWLDAKNYDGFISEAEPHRLNIDTVNEDDVAEIFYTSGTSAQPKGVMLSHRNIYLHAMHVCMALGVENSSVELHTIPLFHANGWGVAHFLTALGGKHVMVPAFDPKVVFQLIQDEKANHFSVVPIMATVLVNHPDRKNYDLSSVKRIILGGAAASPTLVREVQEAFGCECFAGYGLTETSPTLSVSRMKPELDWEGEKKYAGEAMAGFAIPGVEFAIVDAEDKELPQDGVAFGEIVARGDGVMKGYWNQPQATADVMRGGWFHTGDMASIDKDGYVQIVDRKKDIIVSGGENISSLEVEKVMLSHPAVLEVAVIPVAHARWGEVPKALVVLKPSAEASEASLIEHTRGLLSHYKCPHSVVFVEALPKTGTGKVLKKDLRKQYAEHVPDATAVVRA